MSSNSQVLENAKEIYAYRRNHPKYKDVREYMRYLWDGKTMWLEPHWICDCGGKLQELKHKPFPVDLSLDKIGRRAFKRLARILQEKTANGGSL
jgi:hypothetical protein